MPVVVVGASAVLWYPRAPAESTTTAGGRESFLTTVREVHKFDSFAALVATADAVAVIRVEALDEASFDDPDGGFMTIFAVTAGVEEVLAGSLSSDRIKLVFDFAYSEPALRGTDRDWTAVGRRVLIALHQREDGAAYRPLNRQSVFLLSEDGDVSAIWTDPLTASLNGRSLAEMREVVTVAKQEIQQGRVTPQPERPVSSSSP